jgi:UDP-N-acetylmuramate dehydrogenase
MPLAIQENVPLAPLTTLGVGGPARYFFEAQSDYAVIEAVQWTKERSLPLFVLGGGSNLLVADRGFPGLVLKVAINEIGELTRGYFVVGAGESWDAFVARAIEANCGGVECLSGIPGTVGGTPVQNVGAYGQEVSETIGLVKAVSTEDGSFHEFKNPECAFGYRRSKFNTSERGRWIITEVWFLLQPDARPSIGYRDLKDYFGARKIAEPTLQQTRDAVREIRRSKAMLIVPGDDDARSAGSFFKNPVLAPDDYQRLVELAAQRGEKVPSYPAPGQTFKVPAAWLVEHSGLAKGTTRGPVGISRKHALAIVNRGGATAADVIAFKNEIQQRVRATFGVELAPEPVMVGFDEG